MHYIFDVKDAEDYGLEEAVMLYNIRYWITLNKANNTNFYDGRTWTYNSISAFKELFPFWTENQIRRILKSLIDKHILITGNYNKVAYDRTLWYSFFDNSICEKIEMESYEMSNRIVSNDEPIPDSNTYNKPIVNTDKRKRFIPPTREEIQSFTNEHQCHIDIDRFIDYYNSNGWKIGKNKMSDWKATVRNWNRNNKDKGHSGKQSFDKTLNECEQLFESIKRDK